MKVVRKPLVIEGVEEIDFGLVDGKGRKIGCTITRGNCDCVFSIDPTIIIYTNLSPGHHYFFRPSITRNGKPFGAAQSERFFDTEEAREKAIAKYVTASKQRMQNNFFTPEEFNS